MMSFCIFSVFLYLVVLFHLNTLRVLSNPWIFLILFCVFLSVFFKSWGACTQSHRTLALVLFKVQWKTWHAFILSSKLAGRCFPEQPRSILHLCRSLLGSHLRLWTLFCPLLYCLLFFFSPGVRWCSHCVIRLPFTCTNCGLDKLTSSEVLYQWNLILTKTHKHTQRQTLSYPSSNSTSSTLCLLFRSFSWFSRDIAPKQVWPNRMTYLNIKEHLKALALRL